MSPGDGLVRWEALPGEILHAFINKLENRTVKVVRLVCRAWKDESCHCRQTVTLRLSTFASQQAPLVEICRGVESLTVARQGWPAIRELGARLECLPRLCKLRIVHQIHDIELSSLSALTSLTSLDLGGASRLEPRFNNVTPTGTWGLQRLTMLTSLSLSGCASVEDASLTHLQPLVHLRKLNLSRSGITGNGLPSIAGCVSLTWLDLGHCALKWPCLSALSTLTSLLSLNVEGSRHADPEYDPAIGFPVIPDSEIEMLTPLFRMTELNLSGRQVIASSAHGLHGLASIGCRLKELVLQDTAFVADGSLNAERHQLQPARLQCVQGLNFLPKMPFLVRLDLSRFRCVSDSHMVVLHTMQSITALNLSYARCLTDRGLAAVAYLTSLTELKLKACQHITYRGMEFLRPLHQLSELVMSSCGRLTDAGLEEASMMASLTKLDCSCCDNITDRGLLKYIATGASSLRTLSIYSCNHVTMAGIARLEAERPLLVIKRF